MGGTKPTHNNWSQDGVFNMDIGAGGNFNDSVPMETIAEFRVVRSYYDAQYGVAGGVQVDVVTKSGTNQFHGHLEGFSATTRWTPATSSARRCRPCASTAPVSQWAVPL
jgi:hypothetical protein